MHNNFDRALSLVLKHEGGYIDHPRDPGGATNMGITQRTLADWRSRHGTRHTISAEDVKALTRTEAAAIYRARYWDAIGGDDLPSGLDYAMFDFAVNSGPSRAIKFLQRAINATTYFGLAVDGKIGPYTIRAAKLVAPEALIPTLCTLRLKWLRTLDTWRYFGRGWERRVLEVEDEALRMAARDTMIVQDEQVAHAGTQTTTTPATLTTEAPSAPQTLIASIIKTLRNIFGTKTA